VSEEVCTLVPGPYRVGGRLRPSPEEAHHLVRSRRLSPGEEVWALSGDGEAARCRITTVTPVCELEVVECHPEWREPRRRVILYPALIRPARLDQMVEQGTALGMHALRLLLTERVERSGVRLDRWRRIAREAVKQCGRARLPGLDGPLTLDELLAAPPGLMLLLEASAALGLHEVAADPVRLDGPASLGVVIGPEGGLSPSERERLVAAGALEVTLGPRRLRSEAAALSALALLTARWEPVGVTGKSKVRAGAGRPGG
jgi:16S rRNA (uracil1498-N3)-methyltransferase